MRTAVLADGGTDCKGLEGQSFAEARQNQCQTSLIGQTRKAAKAKGGNKYKTQIPCIRRLAMFAPFRRIGRVEILIFLMAGSTSPEAGVDPFVRWLLLPRHLGAEGCGPLRKLRFA